MKPNYFDDNKEEHSTLVGTLTVLITIALISGAAIFILTPKKKPVINSVSLQQLQDDVKNGGLRIDYTPNVGIK